MAISLRLPANEELRLIARAQVGEHRATEVLLSHNAGIVITEAKRYRRCAGSLDFEDLKQFGRIGFCTAVKRFDPARGYRLSVYAVPSVRRTIIRGIAETGHIIRQPVNWMPERLGVLQAGAEITARTGQPATVSQIAAALGKTMAHVEALLAPREVLSLDYPENEEEDVLLGDLVEGGEEPEAFLWERWEAEEAQRQIAAALRLVGMLSPLDREVIILEFGLDGNGPRGLAQMAATLGLTRQGANERRKRALKRLRALAEAPGCDGAHRHDRTSPIG